MTGASRGPGPDTPPKTASAAAAPAMPRAGGMRVIDMQTFVSLASTRHFGRTAEVMNTSQPVISVRLSRLETHLGTRLVERSGRGFDLTAEGAEVLHAFRAILDTMHRLESGIERPDLTQPRELRIGAIDSVVATWLPGLVEGLRARYPGLRIDLTVDGTKSLVAALDRGELDIIFALDPMIHTGFGNFIACIFQMSWVAAPRLITPGRIYTVDELARMPIITFPKDTPPYRTIAPYFQDEQALASKLTSCNSLFAIISLAVDGFGIGAIPTVTVRREIEAGTLVPIRVAKRFPALPIVASYRRDGDPALLESVTAAVRDEVAAFCARLDAPTVWSE